jgi:hypothetical protein
VKQPQVTRTPEEWDAYWAGVGIEPVPKAVKKGKQPRPARLGGKALEKLRRALNYGLGGGQYSRGLTTRLFNLAMPAKMQRVREERDGDILLFNRICNAHNHGFHNNFPAYVEAVLAGEEKRFRLYYCDFADAGTVAEQAILLANGMEEVGRMIDGQLFDAYKQLGEAPIADWHRYSMFAYRERVEEARAAAKAADPISRVLTIPAVEETDDDRYFALMKATQLGADRNTDWAVKGLVLMSVIFRQCGITIQRHLARHRRL